MKRCIAILMVLGCSIAAGQTVRDFGAVGDGSVDDTAAFQAAIAANKLVRVPAGTYRVSQIRLATGTNLVGEDRAATVILDAGAGGVLVDGSRACVLILDTTGSRVANLTIRGRGCSATANDIGLCLHAASEAQVENVRVEQFTGRGVWLQHRLTSYCEFRGLSVHRIYRTSKKLYGIGIWVYGSGSGGVGWKQPHHVTFFDTTVSECNDAGVAIDAGTSTGAGFAPYAISFFGLSVRDCAIKPDGGAAAVGFTGATHCLIDGLTIGYEKEKPTGPQVFFGKDNSGVQTSYCTVTDALIQRGWTTPVTSDKTDGSNQVSNVTIQDSKGVTARVGCQTY
jgi:hypothetical protein